MARPYVRSIKPRDAKEIFGKLSQTNHYQVSFGSLPGEVERHIHNKFGVFDANNFMSRKGGFLCSDASLPGSSLATGEVKDNFMGIPQEFAHTRLYADVDFTFYVDIDYTNLRIFEGWIDYISSGSESTDGMNELTDNYYRRMQYPENYKANTMYITKFEKDIDNNMGRRLDYLFVNAFPKMVNAIPVSYGGADILKVGVSFNYDRYIMNPRGPITRGDSGSFTDVDRIQASAESQQIDTDKFRSLDVVPIFAENWSAEDAQTSSEPVTVIQEGPGSKKNDENSGPYSGIKSHAVNDAKQQAAKLAAEANRQAIRDQIKRNDAAKNKHQNRPDLYF